MKYIEIPILFIFLFSCNNARINNKPLNIRPDTILVYDKTEDLNFEKNDIDTTFHLSRLETPYKGRLLSKAQWKDHNGQNRLIVSIQDTNYAEGFGKYELFAYQYIKKDNIWEINWRMNDFVEGMGCDLKIDVLLSETVDINKDGSAEFILIYTLDKRCDASLLPTKLLLYESKNKLAIRGYSQQFLLPPLSKKIILNNPELKNRDSSYYKKIDTSQFFGKQIIIDYASITWDSIIEAQNKNFRKQ